MTWAIEQKTGSPRAKCVLLSIANYANALWCAWPKQELIAEESEQSPDSVQKYLADMIGPGLVRRIKLKRHGRRTHDFLILRPSPLYDAPLDDVLPHLPSGCDVMPDAAASDGSVSEGENATPPIDSENDAAADSGSVMQPPTALHAADIERQPIDEPVKKDSPPKAPLTAQNGQAKEAVDQELEDWLERFRLAYPLPSSNPDQVRELAMALSPEDRDEALRCAHGVAAFHLKNPKRGLVGPQRFLRSRALWREFERFLPDTGKPVRHFVAEGSEEWRANAVLHAILAQPMPAAHYHPDQGCKGAEFAARLPPAGLVLAQFAGADGSVDLDSWLVLEAQDDRARVSAWCERVYECTAIRFKPIVVALPERRDVEVNGKIYSMPRKITGLRVPCEWPPAKSVEMEFADSS
jgi:hypothetical protein